MKSYVSILMGWNIWKGSLPLITLILVQLVLILNLTHVILVPQLVLVVTVTVSATVSASSLSTALVYLHSLTLHTTRSTFCESPPQNDMRVHVSMVI